MVRAFSRRPAQQGVALLSFVAFLTVVVTGVTTAVSASLLSKHQATLVIKQQAYVQDSLSRVESFYQLHAGAIDDNISWDSYSDAVFKSVAVDQEKHGVKVVVSNRLLSSSGKTRYRNVLVYLISDTDDRNPPNIAKFKTTGIFDSCGEPDGPCADRVWGVFSGQDLQEKNYAATVRKLQETALHAQSYFKARVLQDPEKNAGINYFVPPLGCAYQRSTDLPCLPASGSGYVLLENANIASTLGLDVSLYTNAWGLPVEVTNQAPDAHVSAPPFSMRFRTRAPWGDYLAILATPNL